VMLSETVKKWSFDKSEIFNVLVERKCRKL